MSGTAAYNFFVGKGWSPFAAAGIAGNLGAESNFNPAARGDSGLAYGLAQWHPDRQATFANVMGHPIRGSTFEQQLSFVDWELNNTEKRAGGLLRGATSAEQAAVTAAKYYERPADSSSYGKRKSLASSLLNQGKGALQGALGNLGLGGAVKNALANAIPGGQVALGVAEGLGITGECGYLCQFQNWVRDSGFFQRLALATLAFIIMLGALYLMKGAPSFKLPSAAKA